MATNKECELCGNPATMFCDSDQASLCWDCDEKVHAANFLVAKHSRTLLCHACRLPTPWKAAGPKLTPTVSVCRACAGDREVRRGEEEVEVEGGCDSAESESDDGEYYSDDYSEDENQVVPWSDENVSVSSSSKRTRDCPFESEDEDGCCSSQDMESKFGEVSELSFRESSEKSNYGGDGELGRPLKTRRLNEESGQNPADGEAAKGSSGTAAIVEKLRRFQQGMVTEEGDTSAVILGLCKVTRY